MTARKKWRTITDGATKSHPSEAAVYRWIHSQPQGAIVRIEILDGRSNGWAHYETVEANGTGSHAEVDG